MKIIVSVGHTLSGYGCGAIGILNESIENRNVAAAVKKHLEQQGHEVIFLQIDKIGANDTKDYVQRTAQANKYNADLFVEIHFNASNGAGKGTEVFYTSEKGKPFAQKITNAIAELGFSNRGAKHTDSLYVLNNTKMPAVLVECCFVDNKEDTDRYKQVGADKVARKIVKGITGVEPVDKPVSTPSEEKAPAGQYYRVQLGAYTYKKYAEEMLEKVKKAGFTDAFIKLS